MARYALVIGISQYKEPFEILNKTITDATAVADFLKRHGKYERVTPLIGDVTEDELSEALKTLLQKQAVRNEVLIYFTGHGFTVTDSLGREEGYLATSDCSVKTKGSRITGQMDGFALNSLNALLEDSKVSNLVMLLDACHSGSFLEEALVRRCLLSFSKIDYYLISSCRGSEQAFAKRRDKHSVFTTALLAGLSQENADEKGCISIGRLFDFIAGKLQGKQEAFHLGGGRSIVLLEYKLQTIGLIGTKDPVKDNKGEIICPYQGLQAFEREQKEFFFGRKQLVEAIKQNLDETPFVPVIGASGSGKSSVVRAGLIPWLEEEGNWQILEPIKPGFEPLVELRVAFKPFFKGKDERQLKAFIENGETHPKGLVSIIEQLPNSKRFLLVVDQFEEVFTVCADEEERQRFIELLAQVTEISACRLAIVTTMRADFLEPCLRYAALYHLIQTQAVYMPPLERSDLRDIIVKPANRQGYKIEEGLLWKILEDIGKEPGFLPLLEFSLTKLWKQRNLEKPILTLEQYEKLGKLSGALHLHAERVYQYQDYDQESPTKNRSEQEQEWIKRILLRLIRTGEGQKDTRQRQRKAELLAIASDNSDERDIISDLLDGENGLAQGRLIVADKDEQGDEWIDLSHEALMDGWHRFKEWRQINREAIRLVNRIEDDYQVWNTNHRSNEFLLSGGLLTQVRRYWSELRFYIASEKQEFYRLSQDYEFHNTTAHEEIDKIKQQLGEIKKFSERSQQDESWFFTPGLSSEDDSFSQALEASQPTIEFEVSNHPDKNKLMRTNKEIDNISKVLDGYSQQMKTQRIAADWLIENRVTLVDDIVKSILDNAVNHTQNDKDLVSQGVDKYINWLYENLLRGQPDISKLQAPIVFSGSIYAQAFESFAQKLVSYKLSSEVIKKIRLYLNLLLHYFSSLQE